MNVKELNRRKNKKGQIVVEIEADKQMVRLINTYDAKHTLEDMVYTIACQKLSDRLIRSENYAS
jgi:hypothetical protein